MAKKNPKDNKGSGKPDPNDPQSKADLPEWLRTDDWLQITPPPIKKPLPDSPSGKLASADEQKTDMIELEDLDDADNIDVPPSTMLFSDPDDSVVLTDDLAITGPLSGKLLSGHSSIKLPISQPGSSVPVGDPVRETDSKYRPAAANAPSSGKLGGEDAIDLGVLPAVENPALAGPSTSAIRRPGTPATTVTPVVPVTSEDAIGQPLKPTQPASGWLMDSTKLPDVAADSKSHMPSVPSVANMNSTWAELDLPASKLQPPAPKAPATPPAAEAHPDSWHPSSGNIGVPSMANIDLPPEIGNTQDIFSKASRPGAGPAALKIEIPKPKPIARSEPPKVPEAPPASSGPIPASPSLALPSVPELPTSEPKGSWHPSSGNLHLPSTADLDLPPSADVSDVFSGANRPGRGVEAKLDKQASPKIPAPPAAPAKPAAPALSATNFEIAPEAPKPITPAAGWLSGTGLKSPPPAPVGLDPTSDFQSSADIVLPPEKAEGASDIFSTATKPKPAGTGGSGLFSGAKVPDSAKAVDSLPGESNLFADRPEPKSAPSDTGRVDLAPTGLEVTGELNLSQLLPGSRSGAINFALPAPTAGDSRASSIEILDTSGSLDGDKRVPAPDASMPYEALRDDDANLEAELARQLQDDDGKTDFNFLPGVSPSDSNILGDRTMSERSRAGGPQSSSVNLADPDALSADPAVDSGQPSSIFNKMDAAALDAGHVDLDEIPLMGSSDSGTMNVDAGNSAVLGGRLDDPMVADLEESVFDVTMPKDEAADSGMIDWSADAAKVTDRLGMQASMEDSRRAELSAGSDQPSMPTVPRKAAVPRPTSRPDIDLGEVDAPRAPSKSRNAILASALSLLAGAGIGAGAMFLTGGSNGSGGGGDTKADPAAIAKLSEVQGQLTVAAQAADDAKKQIESLNAAAVQLKADAEANAAAAGMAKALADDKRKLEVDIAEAKKVALAAEANAKKLAEDKTALLADVKKATDDAAKLMTAATDAKKDAEEKGKLLDSAKIAADGVAAKLKAADGLLDPVLEKLKAAKLIDDKADREKALAALPDAIKKANLIAGEGDIAKLAKEIAEARDLLKSQKIDADKKLLAATEQVTAAKKESEKMLADAKTASEKAMADLQAKVDTADKRIVAEVKKAVADATKDAETKLAKSQEMLVAQQQAAKLELQKESTARAAESKQYEARMAELAGQFEKQLASARAGAVVPLSDLAVAKAEQSANAYDTGSTAYFAGRYADAEKAFADAAKADPSDARYWYFLGLSKFAQGKSTEATADFKTGAEWEGRAKPGRRAVAAALERIQGPARLALEAARP